jgi:predicted transcriptional regulator of viral defense system
VKAGLFTIVPPELGSVTEYADNPYLIARRVAGAAPCFISHGSAMEIHRMVTEPQLVVFASSPKRIPKRVLQGTEFRFVLIKAEQVFGTSRHWVSKQESVDVSDLERTVIDGLRHSAYCGGVTEVIRGLWMRRKDMNAEKLIDYALRLGVGAVVRRLGYVLEASELATPVQLQRLQKRLTEFYVPLDPLLPREGSHVARWRLLVNIPSQELDAARES